MTGVVVSEAVAALAITVPRNVEILDAGPFENGQVFICDNVCQLSLGEIPHPPLRQKPHLVVADVRTRAPGPI